jgi:hypothetical protein
MKNRAHDQARTVKSNYNHSTKSTPSVKAVINYLLTGKPLHHTDWTKAHEGEQHRLGITIHRLRHTYGFKKLITTHTSGPLKNHYQILGSDLQEAEIIARHHGLI